MNLEMQELIDALTIALTDIYKRKVNSALDVARRGDIEHINCLGELSVSLHVAADLVTEIAMAMVARTCPGPIDISVHDGGNLETTRDGSSSPEST